MKFRCAKRSEFARRIFFGETRKARDDLGNFETGECEVRLVITRLGLDADRLQFAVDIGGELLKVFGCIDAAPENARVARIPCC